MITTHPHQTFKNARQYYEQFVKWKRVYSTGESEEDHKIFLYVQFISFVLQARLQN